MADEYADLEAKFLALPTDRRLGFTLFVLAQIESNELEGQHATAQGLRGLMGFLSRADERAEQRRRAAPLDSSPSRQ